MGLRNLYVSPLIFYWLVETDATLSPDTKFSIPYKPLLFNKIKFPQPAIKELLYKIEKYNSELLKSRAAAERVNTKAELARKLVTAKARLI
jgi:hypothetical protein